MIRIFLLIFFIQLISIKAVYSQEIDPIGFRDNNQADTIDSKAPVIFDKGTKNTFKVLFSGTPGRAALYSLILPGAGQAYNKRYWKIPLVYAALGGVGYLLYDNIDIYNKKKQDYLDNIDTPQASIQFSYYLLAKKNKELAIFSVIGVYLFNIFDAYIDRHLIEFDIDEDLSMNFGTISSETPAIGLTFSYNITESRIMKRSYLQGSNLYFTPTETYLL